MTSNMKPPPICMKCAHLGEIVSGRRVCTAFADGIPMEIFLSEADHRVPFPGDGGVVFEPRDPEEWRNSTTKQAMDEIFGDNDRQDP